MQKKIIALAVAGLASTAAFAQSNVTIYGIADMGYQYSGSSEGNLKSRSGFDSGLQSGSRLGFRGVEDLGNGLKAVFTYEMGVNVDQGTSAQGGRTYGRQSFLALAGNFGTFAFGRQYTPQYGLVNKVDPFGTGTSGDASWGRGLYTMATGRYIAQATGLNTVGEIRLNNLAAYVSPTFNGFNVIAGYTFDGLDDEQYNDSKITKDTDAKIWAINPNYSNGPLFVGLNYHKTRVDSSDADSKVWDLGATYDFGVVKLAALYGQAKDSVGVNDNKDKKWMIGASAPVGAVGNVQLSYARLKSSGDVAALDGDKASKWAVGYTHSLSKRTNLYAAYAHVSTNSKADGQFSVAGTGSAVTGDYHSGVSLGLRHQF